MGSVPFRVQFHAYRFYPHLLMAIYDKADIHILYNSVFIQIEIKLLDNYKFRGILFCLDNLR